MFFIIIISLVIVDFFIIIISLFHRKTVYLSFMPVFNNNSPQHLPISIIIPTRNSSNRLDQIIESIYHQNHISIHKIIIMVDYSEDTTINLAYELAYQHPEIIVIDKRESNIEPGIASSLRYGASLCESKYLIIVTDDVKFNSSLVINQIVQYIQPMYVTSCLVGIANSPKQKMYHCDKIMRQFVFQSLSAHLNLKPYLPGCFWGIEKETFEIAYPPFNHFTEDYELASFLYGIKGGVKIIQQTLIQEEEKENLNDYFLQQVRWRLGNLSSIKAWIRSQLWRETDSRKIINSNYQTPYIFYLYTSYIFLGVFIIPFLIFLLPVTFPVQLLLYILRWGLFGYVIGLTGQISWYKIFIFILLIPFIQVLVTLVALHHLILRGDFFDAPKMYGKSQNVQ